MTVAELTRLIESKNRMERRRVREKANFDYILADLIGRSLARLNNKSATYPDISKVYPSLFDSEEIKEAKAAQKAKLFTAKFKQFAEHHNKKLQEVAKGE